MNYNYNIIAKAVFKNAKMSAQKVRLVVNCIRGKDVKTALSVLNLDNRKASFLINKVLVSALANAEQQTSYNTEQLYIASVCVDEGMRLKRMKPRARGRSDRILKRFSHISIGLGVIT